MNQLKKKIIAIPTQNDHRIDIRNNEINSNNNKSLPTGHIYFDKDTPEQSFTLSTEHLNSEWENGKPLDGFHFTPITESIFIGIRITNTEFKYLSMKNFLEYTKNTILTKEAPYGYNPWTRKPLNDETTFFVGEGNTANNLQFISFEYSNELGPEYTPLPDSRPNTPEPPARNPSTRQLNLIRIRHMRRRQNQNQQICKNLCIVTSATSSATLIGYMFLGYSGIYIGVAALGASLCITGTQAHR